MNEGFIDEPKINKIVNKIRKYFTLTETLKLNEEVIELIEIKHEQLLKEQAKQIFKELENEPDCEISYKEHIYRNRKKWCE